MWEALRIDLTPLRGPSDFRRLYVAGAISWLGSLATYVALPLQMAQLTGSYVAVGLMGMAELLPLVVFGLWGGVLADRVDRRRLVVWCELGFVGVLLALSANALSATPQPWVHYLAGAMFAMFDGLQRPSLEAILPRLVAPDRLAAAGALMSLRGNVVFIVGPALGGVIVALGGAVSAYAFDGLTFIISATLITGMAPLPPTAAERSHVLLDLAEAVRYTKSRRDILGTYLVDTVAMLFAYPNALLPFIAIEYDAEWALGLLYASGAVGSLIASATSGWTAKVHHHGRAVVTAALVWSLAIAATGVVHDITFALVMLAIAGAADMVSGLFRSLMWNLTIPDTLRGRMAGIEMLSYSIGPQIGGVRATFTARATSLRTSLISGGLIAATLISVAPQALSALWNFDDRTNADAVRERSLRQRDESTHAAS